MTDDPKQTDNQDDTSNAPFRYNIEGIEKLDAQFANFIWSSFDFSVFQVILGQLLQPILITDEDKDAFRSDPQVSVHPIVRLVFTPQMMRETIEIFTTQLALFENQKDDMQPSDPNATDESDDSEIEVL